MRKGGFNVYLMKEKPNTSIYKDYKPRFPSHQDVEIQVYVAHTIGNDVSKKMKSGIRCMTEMIIQGFSKGGNEFGGK